MGSGKWTHQTAERIAEILSAELNINVSGTVVRRLLKDQRYSLKSNRKNLSGSSPDRDEQFGIITALRKDFTTRGMPIISIDTKKKELIGRFKNPGQTWCRNATEVKDHDFRSEALGIAVPYGIYDVTSNSGLLVIGRSADTPEFAVNCVARWWQEYGSSNYANGKELLILADGGGSNSARSRMWKKALTEEIADRFGITVTVAHYPTGASKWNPIEHRMFSEISKNWAGEPLFSFETLAGFAAGTTTKTGLHIDACHDKHVYEKGKKISDREMRALNIVCGDRLSKWNYSLIPQLSPSAIIPPLSKKETRTAKTLQVSNEL